MRLPQGIAHLILDQTDSTNGEAARRAADPSTPAPLWILAHRQTAGRGRQGKAWTAPPGNLSATLLLRPALTPHQGAQLSFAACLAVADILAALAPEARVSLKWPNDALLNGRKVAGVLLESSGRGSRLDWLAIGIGLNLAAHPPRAPGAAIAPTSLVAEGAAPPTPEAALERLAARLDHWQRLHARAGFEPLRAAWLARASGLGQRIQARTPHTTLSGTYEDVDADGALVLHTAQGRQRIPAADLFFPD